MVAVKWSDHALARLREQTRYIAEHSGSPEIAWRWATDVFDAADDLEKFPQMGHPLPEFPSIPYLEIIVRKYYRVIYRIVETPQTPSDNPHPTCFIVTVRRTSMLLDESVLNELNAVEA